MLETYSSKHFKVRRLKWQDRESMCESVAVCCTSCRSVIPIVALFGESLCGARVCAVCELRPQRFGRSVKLNVCLGFGACCSLAFYFVMIAEVLHLSYDES